MVRAKDSRGLGRADMGKLIQFDRRGRRAKAKPAIIGNARILLFTGVRYERDGTPVPGRQGPVGHKRKRG